MSRPWPDGWASATASCGGCSSQHLGASPVGVAQTRRVLLAKQLIHETDLPMGEVALAAGFGSVRRFNETFQRLYNRPPAGPAPAGRAGAGRRVHPAAACATSRPTTGTACSIS
jgi:AraC-like DNA-binding protein